jgi:hypothetical protein
MPWQKLLQSINYANAEIITKHKLLQSINYAMAEIFTSVNYYKAEIKPSVSFTAKKFCKIGLCLLISYFCQHMLSETGRKIFTKMFQFWKRKFLDFN